ncbi:hypothetical protein NC653_001335 [Populus alba x Populus x berolinensis]|uniref:S-acyltransferase n=1 Tax=Populus alba x Populus x berolinensis TaxID=444605 RepID=A0AAD6RKU6_9ROSI|nr:hypothetical protein NC653_001335 [Populus alba x Populus x berolinensis]
MAWNVFKFCTTLRALGSIMIVLVLGIVGVTYYVIVVANYGPALFHGGLDSFVALLVLVLFHSLYGLDYLGKNELWDFGKLSFSPMYSTTYGRKMMGVIPSPDYPPRYVAGCHWLPLNIVMLVMLLWSYFTTVLTDPGGVPPNWRPSIDEESGDADPLVRLAHEGTGLDLNQSAMLGEPANPRTRVCRKCNWFKPPRYHHCSVCRRCILKMDHHCVWVVNCVGALNYKYFLLFLFYTFLVTTLVTSSLLPQFIAFFTDGEKNGTPETLVATFVAFVLNLSFALSIMGFLIMHISLVLGNTTTIEAFEKKSNPKWHYDLGRRKNFEQVTFGLFVNLYPTTVCLGRIRDTGSSLLIQKRIWNACQCFKVLNIQQDQTWMSSSSSNGIYQVE